MTTATRRKTQGAPEGLNEYEYERLMAPDAIGDRRASTYKRDRMLLELLAGTGLRINEALSLNRDRVDLAKRSIWIPAALAKSGRMRVVYFGPALATSLQCYLAGLPAEQWALFVTRTGARLTDSHVRRLFKKIAGNTGLDPGKVHPHVLRHTYASRFLGEGGTIEDLKLQLGHASIAITNVYLQGESWHRAEHVARLDL
jgi:site-specific recombinase XerD